MTTYGELFERMDNEAMLDKLADILTVDTLELDNLLDDVAQAETDEPQLKDYLALVMKRFTVAPLKVNEVRVTRDEHGVIESYYVYNYTYSMYKWFVSHNWDTVFARPRYLLIDNEWLTEKERSKLSEKIT